MQSFTTLDIVLEQFRHGIVGVLGRTCESRPVRLAVRRSVSLIHLAHAHTAGLSRRRY